MNQKIKNNLVEKFIKPAFAQLKGKNNGLIVENSFPILWFGNLEKYLASKLKILTLGLNPSKLEFDNDRFNFSLKNKIDFEKYINSLNEYFVKNPYEWFNSFNCLLKIFNTSYGCKGDDTENIAIHIDAISPFATNVGISKLSAEGKRGISADYEIREFISLLEPDIVLASINKDALKTAFGDNAFESQALYRSSKNKNTPDSKLPYIRLYKSDKFFIINGRCRNKPFGGMNAEWREKTIKKFFEKITQ
ncbi:MAG: hypothetical protein J6T16_06345 [Opitutales bacterium]|nr:hypothetical protein [Opitutales bacterium]